MLGYGRSQGGLLTICCSRIGLVVLCHLLVLGEKDTKVSIKAGSSVIIESNEEKLLGAIIDRKLNFKKHLFTVCNKARQKLQYMLLQGLRCIYRKKKLR